MSSAYEKTISIQENIIKYIEILKEIYDNKASRNYYLFNNLVNNTHFIDRIQDTKIELSSLII